MHQLSRRDKPHALRHHLRCSRARVYGRYNGPLRNAPEAQALATRLHALGYPAEVRSKRGVHEVRVSQFTAQDDAQTVLKRWQADASLGVANGRVALAAN